MRKVIKPGQNVTLALLAERQRVHDPGECFFKSFHWKALVGKSGPKHGIGFRPVAEYTANDTGAAAAGTQHGDAIALEGDLHLGIDFQHMVRREEHPGFTQVNGFTCQPVLLSMGAIA